MLLHYRTRLHAVHPNPRLPLHGYHTGVCVLEDNSPCGPVRHCIPRGRWALEERQRLVGIQDGHELRATIEKREERVGVEFGEHEGCAGVVGLPREAEEDRKVEDSHGC